MREERHDIFDRIMELPFLRPLRPFYRRHREALLYLFFGVLTTAVSWGTFYLFHYPLQIQELIANILSWIGAVLFAFITNRTWVFPVHGSFFVEMVRFFGARLATLGIEELLLLLFTTCLRYEAMWVKIAGNILVLILNYIFSRAFVFRGK